jgi:hypothetical protein
MIFNSFGDNVDPGTLLDNLKNTGLSMILCKLQ